MLPANRWMKTTPSSADDHPASTQRKGATVALCARSNRTTHHKERGVTSLNCQELFTYRHANDITSAVYRGQVNASLVHFWTNVKHVVLSISCLNLKLFSFITGWIVGDHSLPLLVMIHIFPLPCSHPMHQTNSISCAYVKVKYNFTIL